MISSYSSHLSGPYSDTAWHQVRAENGGQLNGGLAVDFPLTVVIRKDITPSLLGTVSRIRTENGCEEN